MSPQAHLARMPACKCMLSTQGRLANTVAVTSIRDERVNGWIFVCVCVCVLMWTEPRGLKDGKLADVCLPMCIPSTHILKFSDIAHKIISVSWLEVLEVETASC